MTLKSNGKLYSSQQHRYVYLDEEYTYFEYDEEDEVVSVTLYFDESEEAFELELLPSGDFSLIDSLVRVQDFAQFKVRFNQLTNTQFLAFTFRVTRGKAVSLAKIPLLPVSQTYATIYPASNELYIGEEKVFELVSNNPQNLALDNRWTEGLPINYRFSSEGSQNLLHILPTELDRNPIRITIPLRKPRIDEDGKLSFELKPINYDFVVREGRLVFLQLDKQEITPNDDKTEPVLVQIDNHRMLRIGKTYRIENREEAGGALIAELFTKTRLNNDKVLCELRPYAYHYKSDGYLYIKDGDAGQFITNVDITPKTTITKISVQREGKSWEESNVLYPGETVNVKLEGQGLHKSKISFQGVNNLQYDSLIRNENLSLFELKVPLTIGSSTIEIYNFNQPTGKSFTVKEYQRPRTFDFINLDLAGNKINVGSIDKPIYFGENLTDLVIQFDRNKLDEGNMLFGKQFLSIDVKVSSKSGNLIELYRMDRIVICPSEKSPRSAFYGSDDCRSGSINLNEYLSKKTSDLEEWSKIEIEIAHLTSEYGGKGAKKRIVIYLQRDFNFDIDVSFPTGLLIFKSGTKDFTNFGGVSFAMLAQFSFYQPGKIAKYQPFKVGAGFIAIDAFNFSADKSRQDIGLVVIGSLYPMTSDRKLTFPLYTGLGYLLIEGKPFFLIGPGIRVRL